jgi:leucyl-tRNA synthetase
MAFKRNPGEFNERAVEIQKVFEALRDYLASIHVDAEGEAGINETIRAVQENIDRLLAPLAPHLGNSLVATITAQMRADADANIRAMAQAPDGGSGSS